MSVAIIKWTAYRRLTSLDALPDEGQFYMIASARRHERRWQRSTLLYLGLAYATSVKQRIRQSHQSYRFLHEKALGRDREIVVATANLIDGTQFRRTRALCEDIENLLIFNAKPKHNSRGIQSYNGRQPLVVVSTGSGPAEALEISACCEVCLKQLMG